VPDSGPVVPRPAATVMLVRDAADATGLEVLMVRRNLRSDFVGGAYVFPGGAVDGVDGGDEAEAICTGRTDGEASTLLGVPSGGLAYWVAVLRECFEEAGLLLATTSSGEPLSFEDPEDARRFVAYRDAVNEGRRRFLDVCHDEALRLPVADVHYFAHWITPEGAPRRYDTRFFVARAPAGQRPVHDASETIATEWLAPAEALRRHREGAFELIFPTIRNLQAIGRFADSTALLDAAAAASGQVPTVEPRVVRDGGAGVRIVLPGDDGYEQAEHARAPADPGNFNDAVRAISHGANPEPAAGT
jgi:8-oxo-dGTP pyrophosphatase MutT (NUDIX family)